MLTFAFMHHPYLVCTLFGMPSLHLFTFLMFFIFLFLHFFDVNLKIEEYLSLSVATEYTTPELETALIV